MSHNRSVLISAVLALGVALAPVAMAASPTPSTAKATTAPTAGTTHKSTSAKPAKVHIDLNTATREQLMTLPGIGDATADRIIAARPFKSKEELKSKGIVTKAEYDKLASKVTAKSEPMKK